MSKRVLFLYISPSSGHQHAADSIREALTLIAHDWETYGVDSFSFAYPTIGRLIARTYLEVLRLTPMVWDYVYDNPDVEAATREIRDVLNLISAPKMKTLITRYNPQALVCTQAVPCSVFAAEKRRGELKIPLVAVITDFAIHAYWIYEEVDLYCVASEEARHDLIGHGIPASRIAVTGIPISPSFLQSKPKEQVRAQLGLDPHQPTVLIMGGSQGMGPLQEMLNRMQESPLQCIVVTGLNRELYRFLRKTHGRSPHVSLFGYTHQVSALMDAADILVTKPGGLTTSEALAKNLPMILTNPIPGQEERNTRYLLKQGVAERADSPEEMAQAIQALIAHPARLQGMIDRIRAVATPYAAMEIARWIYRLITASVERPPVSFPTLSSRRSWGRRGEYDKIPRVP